MNQTWELRSGALGFIGLAPNLTGFLGQLTTCLSDHWVLAEKSSGMERKAEISLWAPV